MQSRLSFFVLATAVALLAVSGLGCPSSSGCKVDDPCDTEFAIECVDDTTVRECVRNAAGCLGWVETACATGMVCEEGADEIGCVVACDHECDPLTHPACGADGTSIETCVLQNDGCFDLFVTDCDPELVCDDSGEEPACVCVDDCDPEMYPACSEDFSALETCVEGLDGCFDLVATDCGAGALCEDDGAEPACVVQCTDDCDVADYPACAASGFAVETCEEQPDGCNDVIVTDCPMGEACNADTAACEAAGCSDDCDPANYPACGADGASIDACERQADGCYDLLNAACGAEEICDASGGAPMCTCVNDCDPAVYPACSIDAFAVVTCVEGADTCYDLVVTDCGAGETCNADTFACESSGCSDDCDPANFPACGNDGASIDACVLQPDNCYDVVNTGCGAEEICDDSGAEPVCTCVNNCVPGDYPACDVDGLAVETCEQQADGCYDLISTACENNDVCDPDTLTCVAPCQNECDPANFPACSADTLAIETCVEQADTCYDIVSSACGGDLFCDDSSGQPECVCTDDCDPANFPACSADGLAIETCVEQADACYDVITTACGGDLTCDDSGADPVCVCTDECPTDGEVACNADLTAITLCEAQADGCNDLLVDTDCAGNAQECDPTADPIVCVACEDECPAADATRCEAGWIETCVVGPDTCLDWSQTTDCAGNGQYCDDTVDPLVCADFGLLVSGTDCNDANLVALSIPAELPAQALNETTCGAVDDYSDTCMGNYDGDEDVVYLLDVTEATSFNVILDPKGTTWTGMGVGLGCPLDAVDCLIGGGYSGGDAYMTGCLDAAPGSYTLMVDIWPDPYFCIADYDLWIQECVCVPGETACTDATTLATCTAMGQWEETPCDGTCAEVAPDDFQCVYTPQVAGDLVITEIIQNPAAVGDGFGEWFEVYNASGQIANLNGLTFQDDDTDSFTVDVDVLVPDGGFAVLGTNGDQAVNGGVAVDYEYGGGMFLGNSTDELEIFSGAVSIDRVVWDNGATFPDPSGASMSLNALFTNATDNDDGANWCEGVDPYGDGDLGTPGAANPVCPLTAIYFSDDLDADPGWTVSGDWAWGMPDAAYVDGPAGCANDSAGCYGTNLAGDYSSGQGYDTCNVAFGPVDLSAAGDAYLTFAMWLDAESGYDSARVEVSVDGAVWTTLDMLTPAYNFNDPADSWSGNTMGEWWPAMADLTPLVGGDVWVRFALDSDGSVQHAGLYVDDVVVGGY